MLKQKSVPDRDKVVILDSSGQADIAVITDEDEQAIYASSQIQDYAIPKGDIRAFVSPSGRIFCLAADADYVSDTVRLAALEQSIVLKHITHYQKPPAQEQGGIKIREILMYALIGILILAVIFK